MNLKTETHSFSVPCPVAEDRLCRVVSKGTFLNRSNTPGDVSVATCSDCGMGFSHPPVENVASLYSGRETQDFRPESAGFTRFLHRLVFGRDARHLLAGISPTPSCTLDYGCGSGVFTRCLAEYLPDGSRVIGADFQSVPPGDLGRAEYHAFAELEALAGQVDLLLAMHVLEHDNDPRTLVKRLMHLVRPGGCLVMEVPLIESAWIGIFGKFWDPWYLPYHRVHFNRTAFRTMLEGCGLTILWETNKATPSMGRTIANLLGKRNGIVFILLTGLLLPVQWSAEHLTGRPSAVRVVARKG